MKLLLCIAAMCAMILIGVLLMAWTEELREYRRLVR